MLNLFRNMGAALSRFTERWVPDSWVVCMILTAVALALAIALPEVTAEEAVLAWGSGLWTLLALAMQFTIAMVAAYACVSSKPVFAALDRLAGLPNPDKPLQAVLLASCFSIFTAYLNWAFCLVACALFVPFLCRRNPKADVRILILSCYIGLGTVWHGGFSGSAPLILATPGNPLLEPGVGDPIVDRLIPVTETLFSSFNLVYMVVIAVVGIVVTIALHPTKNVMTLSEDQVNAILPQPPKLPPNTSGPAGVLDRSRLWILLAVALIAYPLGHSMVTRGFGTTWTINAYNSVFLVAALLLHGRPDSFVNACKDGVGAAWGIILQFPFYAGIFGIMNNTELGPWLGSTFASMASERTFPMVVYAYSGMMNLFVPSAGSKWLIEAPYLIPAGAELGVSAKTVLLAYMYGDSTTNLIQPFWAIPILAVTRLRFGDIVGYTFLAAVACFAVTSVAMFLIPAAL